MKTAKKLDNLTLEHEDLIMKKKEASRRHFKFMQQLELECNDFADRYLKANEKIADHEQFLSEMKTWVYTYPFAAKHPSFNHHGPQGEFFKFLKIIFTKISILKILKNC